MGAPWPSSKEAPSGSLRRPSPFFLCALPHRSRRDTRQTLISLPTFVFTFHMFLPVYNGKGRKWGAGVLEVRRAGRPHPQRQGGGDQQGKSSYLCRLGSRLSRQGRRVSACARDGVVLSVVCFLLRGVGMNSSRVAVIAACRGEYGIFRFSPRIACSIRLWGNIRTVSVFRHWCRFDSDPIRRGSYLRDHVLLVGSRNVENTIVTRESITKHYVSSRVRF